MAMNSRRLRRDLATAKVPIILLTSRGKISEKEAGFEAGADDYLVKPVVPAELELKIRVLLSRAKADRVVAQARGDQRFQLAWGVLPRWQSIWPCLWSKCGRSRWL
jgi:DNA-binding response OmpR family regulator